MYVYTYMHSHYTHYIYIYIRSFIWLYIYTAITCTVTSAKAPHRWNGSSAQRCRASPCRPDATWEWGQNLRPRGPQIEMSIESIDHQSLGLPNFLTSADMNSKYRQVHESLQPSWWPIPTCSKFRAASLRESWMCSCSVRRKTSEDRRIGGFSGHRIWNLVATEPLKK